MSRAPSLRDAETLIIDADTSLLDVVDNLLTKGVVVTGEVLLALAGVDLVYLRISALLSAADRVVQPDTDVTVTTPARRRRRTRARRRAG